MAINARLVVNTTIFVYTVHPVSMMLVGWAINSCAVESRELGRTECRLTLY